MSDRFTRRHTWIATVSGVIIFVITVWAFFFRTPAQLAEDASAVPSPTVSSSPVDAPSAELGYDGGWGPERDMFTGDKPAGYAVLNSISDNPLVGDERNFVRLRIADSDDKLTDFVRADIGDEIEINVYVSNGAADNLDGSAATIHGLEADFAFPPAGKDLSVGVTLRAKNAAEVWDGATVLTTEPALLRPVGGSALMVTNSGRFEVPMGESVGILPLGWSSPDGEFPVGYAEDGTYRGQGWLVLKARVIAAD